MDFPTIDLKDKIVFESDPDTRVHPGVWRCVRWLEERYAQKICISDLALRAGCGFYDQAHFGRHFRRMFATTPAEFLRAQQLLRREAGQRA
jgi:AraC-like DNA-binding protein